MWNDAAERGQCDRCGRFLTHQNKGGSWMFVPDSHVSHEEVATWCPDCTEEHGPPAPTQRVKPGTCRGVVQ